MFTTCSILRGRHRTHPLLYLLDANVLIDAARDYYPLDRVPEFWSWLVRMGMQGQVKVPQETYDEIMKGNDNLRKWLQENKDALLLVEILRMVDSVVDSVIERGYDNDPDDVEIEKIGADAFLIAYAFVDPQRRCVVTTERSRPKRTGANRHIPDVCTDLDIRCIDTFELIRVLDFRTNR